ncbi:MAG TPA: hypothetical protein VMZ27_15400 [Candidatus Saccharimonadales bacterium]|nr:hypothetical protein [Candidatus Saccharimonadales bacterium]
MDGTLRFGRGKSGRGLHALQDAGARIEWPGGWADGWNLVEVRNTTQADYGGPTGLKMMSVVGYLSISSRWDWTQSVD